MGIIRQGIFGGFEKRTGGLVGRRVKGKNIISAPRHPTDKPMTQAQLDHQKKFELLIRFLKRISNLIRLGFKNNTGKGNAFNAAVKYNFRNLITGASANFSIDYTKLAFSRGSLAGANNPVVSLGLNSVKITWEPSVQTRFNQHTDKAIILVCYPEPDRMVLRINLATRASLECEMALAPDMAGIPMHVFMAFVSADEKEVSNTEYLGTL